jgi:hypothetical protein
MGYDLHITRRKRWSDRGRDITADEWLTYVGGDPELSLQPSHSPYFAIWRGASQTEQPYLDWADGHVYAKYPDPPLISKMVAIAQQFGATVQGDDGEIYSGGDSPQQPPFSIRERIAVWLRTRQSRLQAIPHQDSPFRVGDRVCDVWGNTHTVIEVDPAAMHGMGVIRTRSDTTGAQLGHSMRAHGLTLVQETRNDAV